MIYPSSGVISGDGYSQPVVPPSAPCTKGYGCSTPIDVSALNGQIMELQNVSDLEGIQINCASNRNLYDAICTIATRKACEEITARHFCQTVNGNDGAGSITLPAGFSYDVQGFIWANGDTQGLVNTNGWVGGEIDDNDDHYFAFVCGNYAGGHTFRAADINPDVTDDVRGYSMMISATRVGDC